MKIGIIGSMHFSEKMIAVATELKQLGHEPILSGFIESFIGKDDDEKERIKLEQKLHENAQKADWARLKNADALLVVNLERHGIANYIGGNTLFELAAGYFADKHIYLLNPIPDIPYYKSELEAIHPTILHNNLTLITKPTPLNT